jgi:hypothetical protein
MKRLNNLKWFALGIIVCFLVSTLLFPAYASSFSKSAQLVYNDIKITLDGQAITPKDADGNAVEPFIIDGTTYLPVRAVANALGLGVNWDGATNTVNLTHDEASASGTVLYDENNIKATFLRIYEEPSISGVFYLQLLIENNSDKKIMVALNDASVNGCSTTIMSGVPMEINTGDQSKQPFIISYKNLDASELSEVKNIMFSMCVYDDSNLSSILTTNPIMIDVG